jgi:hypothetical protein
MSMKSVRGIRDESGCGSEHPNYMVSIWAKMLIRILLLISKFIKTLNGCTRICFPLYFYLFNLDPLFKNYDICNAMCVAY